MAMFATTTIHIPTSTPQTHLRSFRHSFLSIHPSATPLSVPHTQVNRAQLLRSSQKPTPTSQAPGASNQGVAAARSQPTLLLLSLGHSGGESYLCVGSSTAVTPSNVPTASNATVERKAELERWKVLTLPASPSDGSPPPVAEFAVLLGQRLAPLWVSRPGVQMGRAEGWRVGGFVVRVFEVGRGSGALGQRGEGGGQRGGGGQIQGGGGEEEEGSQRGGGAGSGSIEQRDAGQRGERAIVVELSWEFSPNVSHKELAATGVDTGLHTHEEPNIDEAEIEGGLHSFWEDLNVDFPDAQVFYGGVGHLGRARCWADALCRR